MAWEKVFCLLILGDTEYLLFRTRNQRVPGLRSAMPSALCICVSARVHACRGTWEAFKYVNVLKTSLFHAQKEKKSI